jgi:NADP-dependent 3-hydroxy acid dehydrogenase YdfG
VTGAASGIGLATALQLAAAGMRVHATDIRLDVLDDRLSNAPESPGLISPHGLDVTDAEAVDRLMADIASEAPVRVLVCAAGTNILDRRLDQLTGTAWARLLELNLTGVFSCVRAALPQLRETRGHVVVIASHTSTWPDAVSGPAYQAAKAGVLQFVRAASAEEHGRGVRFTALLPGMVNTELMDKRPTPPSAQMRATAIQPEDIAATILFALSLPGRACIGELTIVPTIYQAVGQTS